GLAPRRWPSACRNEAPHPGAEEGEPGGIVLGEDDAHAADHRLALVLRHLDRPHYFAAAGDGGLREVDLEQDARADLEHLVAVDVEAALRDALGEAGM